MPKDIRNAVLFGVGVFCVTFALCWWLIPRSVKGLKTAKTCEAVYESLASRIARRDITPDLHFDLEVCAILKNPDGKIEP